MPENELALSQPPIRKSKATKEAEYDAQIRGAATELYRALERGPVAMTVSNGETVRWLRTKGVVVRLEPDEAGSQWVLVKP